MNDELFSHFMCFVFGAIYGGLVGMFLAGVGLVLKRACLRKQVKELSAQVQRYHQRLHKYRTTNGEPNWYEVEKSIPNEIGEDDAKTS